MNYPDVLVPGSITHITAHYDHHIPTHLPVYAFNVSDVWNPSDDELRTYCTVRWEGHPTTCHVCEGGHHVHIVWTHKRS